MTSRRPIRWRIDAVEIAWRHAHSRLFVTVMVLTRSDGDSRPGALHGIGSDDGSLLGKKYGVFAMT